MSRSILGKAAQRVLTPPGAAHSAAAAAAATGATPAASGLARTGLSAGAAAAAAAGPASMMLASTSRRALSTPSKPLLMPAADDAASAESRQGLLSSLLHGSDKAKKEGLTMSHSSAVSRGKHVHEIIRHEVKPDCTAAYKAVLAEYYPKIAADERFALRHVGSWEVFIGDLDTFFHIWEYDGYEGYDKCESAYHESD
ncbi:hypothetical protein OC834_002399, partial [Tilletia horrida]